MIMNPLRNGFNYLKMEFGKNKKTISNSSNMEEPMSAKNNETSKFQRLPFLLVLLLVSCVSSDSKTISKSATGNFDWLLGDWIRTNDEAGRTTYEIWNKQSNTLYNGIGLTINSEGDTVFREDLKLLPAREEWLLEVTGVNESPTRFNMVDMGAANFKVKNLENEFPKYIEYMKDGKHLKAKVYNDDGNVIDFEFRKIN